MEENSIVKYEGGIIKRIGNQIEVTNKLLALSEPQLIPYRKGDKWGYCTADKKIIIDCLYDEVSIFSEGLAAVKINGKNGFINKKNEWLFETSSESADFKNGIAIVYVDREKYEIIDKGGRIICEVQSRYAPKFEENRAIISNKFKEEGIIDITGNLIVEVIYKRIDRLCTKVFVCYLERKCKVVNLNGEIIHDFFYDWVCDLVEGYARIYKDGKYGFIDQNGKLVIDCIYESVTISGNCQDDNFVDGFAHVVIHKKHGVVHGFINYKGEWFDKRPAEFTEGFLKILESQTFLFNKNGSEDVNVNVYERVGKLQDGFAWVRRNGKFGFVDKNGLLVIDCIYDRVNPFQEELAWVKLNNKWGTINKAGEIIFNFIFQDYLGADVYEDYYRNGYVFQDGISIVLLQNKFGVLNRNGEIINPCIYDNIKKRNDGFIEVEIKTENWKPNIEGYIEKIENDLENIKKGLFDKRGKKILDCNFSYIDKFKNGLAKVSPGGYIDKYGNKYWED